MLQKALKIALCALVFGAAGFIAAAPPGTLEPVNEDIGDFELEIGGIGGGSSTGTLEKKNVKCGDWLKSCSKDICDPGSTNCTSGSCKDNRNQKPC